MVFKKIIFLIAFLCFITNTKANTFFILPEDSLTKDSSSSLHTLFIAGLDFNSTNVHHGIRDPSAKPFWSPNFSFSHKSGLGFSVYANKLIGVKDSGWFELDLNPTYEVKINTNNSLMVSYTRYVFSKTSRALHSALSNDFYLAYKNENDILDFTLTIEDAYGRKKVSKKIKTTVNDFAVNLTAEHPFSFGHLIVRQDFLDVIPGFNFLVGTQNFYSKYQQAKLNAKNQVLSQQENAANAKFTSRSLEFKVDLNYGIRKFNFEPVLTLYKPFHQTVQKPFVVFVLSLWYIL